jgi:hypothetical protein
MDIELVNEGSSVIFGVTFLDENGASVVPNAIAWSLLTDDNTAVVEEEPVTPAASVSVAVNGTYLTLGNQYDQGYRTFVVESTYDSSAGSGLPVVGKMRFRIEDILGV